MYMTKSIMGRGYTVAYPQFEEEGAELANKFYRHLAECAEEYFASLTAEDRRYVCKGTFAVEESDEFFTVDYTVTLRRCGRRCGVKTVSYKWIRFEGRNSVIDG